MAAAAKASPATGGQLRPEGQAAAMEEGRWQPFLKLPCQLTIDLSLSGFTVADFLKLRKGSVISTRWRVSREVSIRVNGALIGWGEFEGSGDRLAIRLTELA